MFSTTIPFTDTLKSGISKYISAPYKIQRVHKRMPQINTVDEKNSIIYGVTGVRNLRYFDIA